MVTDTGVDVMSSTRGTVVLLIQFWAATQGTYLILYRLVTASYRASDRQRRLASDTGTNCMVCEYRMSFISLHFLGYIH